MKMRQHALFACIGWIAGVGSTLGMGFVIFPAIVPGTHFAGTGLDWLILGLVAIPASTAALIGGLVGGRLANEGGRNTQLLMAALIGVMLAMPVSCVAFWVTGW